MIHSFKNHVLRKRDEYRQRAQEDAKELDKAILEYRELSDLTADEELPKAPGKD